MRGEVVAAEGLWVEWVGPSLRVTIQVNDSDSGCSGAGVGGMSATVLDYILGRLWTDCLSGGGRLRRGDGHAPRPSMLCSMQ